MNAIRRTLLFACCWACLASQALAASDPLQFDLLTNAVETLGLSYGLPDEPGVDDYLRIVSSSRSLHLEAEDIYDPSDYVAVKNYHNFGQFSGSGWVSGVSTATLLHLKFLLPWSGRFEASSSLRFAGHTFDFGKQILIGSSDAYFTRVDLGEVDLEAGPQLVTVELPPNGAIDDLDLDAPAQPAIGPLDGWHPEQPLTTVDLAATALTALRLLPLLPETERSQTLEAEDGENLQNYVSTQRHLGRPSGRGWVRAGSSPLEVRLPFHSDQPVVLKLVVRGLGAEDFRIHVDELPLQHAGFPEFLADRETGVLALPAGDHLFTATLPPRSGLDSVTLKFFDADNRALLELAGLEPENDAIAQRMSDVNALLAGLAEVH